jgi:hypothetical protein
MKTIKKQEESNFNAISFKDAIILLPLMNQLTKVVNCNRVANLYNNLAKEEQEKYQRVWHTCRVDIPADAAEEILEILHNLGFESQIDLHDANMGDLELK